MPLKSTTIANLLLIYAIMVIAPIRPLDAQSSTQTTNGTSVPFDISIFPTQLTHLDWANPYGFILTEHLKDTANFTMTLRFPSEVGESDLAMSAVWTDLLKAFGLFNRPEGWRIQLQPYASQVVGETSYSVLIGPPISNSKNSTRTLWEYFLSNAIHPDSTFYSSAFYPALSWMDGSKTQLLSYACQTNDLEPSFDCIGSFAAAPPTDPSTQSQRTDKRHILMVSLAVLLPVITCFICLRCSLRAAKLSESTDEDGSSAPEVPDQLVMEITTQLQSTQSPTTLCPTVIVPVHQLHYPGSPFRLSDGLPTTIMPVKYGDFMGEEGESRSPSRSESFDSDEEQLEGYSREPSGSTLTSTVVIQVEH